MLGEKMAKSKEKNAKFPVGHRKIYENHYFNKNVNDHTFAYMVLRRVGATGKTILNTNFSYCILEDCYFKDCIFKDCNFNGAVFRNSNFHASKFENCNFEYAEFHAARFPEYILESPPRKENLNQKFAQRLKVNFQNLGEKKLTLLATKAELAATETFLFKAWFEQKHGGYYRSKYPGRKRAIKFLEWSIFRMLKFVWRNGQSFAYLARTTAIAIVAVAVLSYLFRTTEPVGIIETILKSPALFFGSYKETVPEYFNAIILVIRLVLFSLFISMLVRKWTFK
jgi:Pentapeptide repeats (8 copies)